MSSSSRGSAPDPALDAYIDGQLDGEMRARFEAGASDDVAGELEVQRRIDEALRRLFREPEERGVQVRLRRRIHPALLGLAAAVLVASAALWLFAASVLHERPSRLEPAYRELVAAGFEPEVVCTTRDEFGAWVKTNYGQALYPPPETPGVEFVGWSYSSIISGYSGVLLARVDGQPVIVVLDRRHREELRQARPDDPALRSYRRTVGDLVLYEVTPLGEARIVPKLSITR